MYRALYTAASGMETQQINLENVANNLANANTTGFRRRRLQFQDLIYQNLVLPGAASTQQTTFPTGLQIGLGTRLAASASVQLQGDVNTTGNTLDLCIQGQGFFQVQLPSGEVAYTRDGSFSLDPTGILVTSDGYQLQPAITIPASATNVTIGTDGTVSVQLPASSRPNRSAPSNWPPLPTPADSAAWARICFWKPPLPGTPLSARPAAARALALFFRARSKTPTWTSSPNSSR